jgi:hypothetical protein
MIRTFFVLFLAVLTHPQTAFAQAAPESVKAAKGGIVGHVLMENGGGRIRDLIEGGPGHTSGLLAEDLIVLVDGQDTPGLSIQELVSLVSGPIGSSVEIGVLRTGVEGVLTYSIIRDKTRTPDGFALNRYCRGTEQGFAGEQATQSSQRSGSATCSAGTHVVHNTVSDVNEPWLNLRASTNLQSKVIGNMPDGTCLTVHDKSSSFWKVTVTAGPLRGTTGFAHKNYISASSTEDNSAACAAAMEAIENREDLQAIFLCLGNTPERCVRASKAVSCLSSFTNEACITRTRSPSGYMSPSEGETRYGPNQALTRVLPILNQPYLRKEMRIDQALMDRCVVGNGRFISDQTGTRSDDGGPCFKLKLHFHQYKTTLLQHGCQEDDLDACLELWPAHRMQPQYLRRPPSTQSILSQMDKFQIVKRLCEDRGKCMPLLNWFPTESQCLQRHIEQPARASVRGKVVWHFETFWQELIPSIREQMDSLCNTASDRTVAMRACTIADQAKRGEGFFETDCESARHQRRDNLEIAAKRQSACMSTNHSDIIAHYKRCAGADWGRGTARDTACELQAQNAYCP